ncbi:hypothetical protein YB2330_000970 [Saitoella coloradoensis]
MAEQQTPSAPGIDAPPLPLGPPPSTVPELPSVGAGSGGAPPLPNEPLPRTALVASTEEESPKEDTEVSSSSAVPIRKAETPAATTAAAKDAQPQDAWQAVWDSTHQAYYFYNTDTKEVTWTNPRVPPGSGEEKAALEQQRQQLQQAQRAYGAVAQDPYAAYAGEEYPYPHQAAAPGTEEDYSLAARFNKRTGRFQADPKLDPSRHTVEARADRQMSAFFDTEQWNQTSGMSLKEERREMYKKLTKKEIAEYKAKKKEKKEMKRRAWLTKD